MDYNIIWDKANKLMKYTKDIDYKHDIDQLIDNIKNEKISVFDKQIDEALKERFTGFYNAGYLSVAIRKLEKFDKLHDDIDNLQHAFFQKMVERTKKLRNDKNITNYEEKIVEYNERFEHFLDLKSECFKQYHKGKESAFQDESNFQEDFCK